MAYSRTYTVDSGPSGDTVKAAIGTKLDGDLTNIFTYLNTHDTATTGVHGLAAATVVGTTTTQTLTNKTLTSPTINTPTVVGATLSGTITGTNATYLAGTVSGVTITGAITASGATIAGGTISAATLTGVTVNGGTVSGGVITGCNIFPNYISAGTLENMTIQSATISAVSMTGTITGTNATYLGGTISGVTMTGTITASGATLLSPAITGATLTNPTIAVASSTNGDMWYQAAGVLARLAKGAANTHMFINAGATAPEWATAYKIGTFQRVMTVAAGDVAYTGVGFKPSNILFLGRTSQSLCVGLDDATSKNVFLWYHGATGAALTIYGDASNSIYLWEASSTYQNASVKSFDADGFTLTWGKSGSPTGTSNIYYMAFR